VKKKGHTLVPRNPFALAARQRHAGAHYKTHKIKRRDDRQVLRKLLRTGKEEDGNTVLFLPEKPFLSREDKLSSASPTPLLERGWVGMGLLCPYGRWRRNLQLSILR
jgi:hypothetical protein